MSGIPGSAHANLGLGGLVILGGAIGYLKKGSVPSIAAGVTFGSLLIGSGYMIAKTDAQYQAHLLVRTDTVVRWKILTCRSIRLTFIFFVPSKKGFWHRWYYGTWNGAAVHEDRQVHARRAGRSPRSCLLCLQRQKKP